jgi:predicted site-specific integrase-resolvase
MDTKLVKIGEAAKILGTTPDTLRKWDKSGELIPDRKTKSGTRYYNINTLLNNNQSDNKKTICYARVSSTEEQEPSSK